MVQRLSEPLIYEQNRKSSKYSSKIKNFKKKGKEDMKKMKKVLAMLIAMVMVLGMSVTTFATTSSTPTSPLTPATMKPSTTAISGNPTSADKVDVKIGGITGAPTITLYQIASAEYGNDGRNGFIQYKWVEANEIDWEEATSGQITEIANQ